MDNKEEVDLFEFTNAMAALNNQYFSLLILNGINPIGNDHKLYIKKISNGSIIIDFCEKIQPMLGYVEPFIGIFAKYIVSVMDYLIGKSTFLTTILNKKDFNDFKKIFMIVAKTNGNILNILSMNVNSPINNYYNSSDSERALKKCDQEIYKLENTDD